MCDWLLSRVVWVADRGLTSVENPRYLRKGGNHYIIGERLRSGSAEADAALSRQGRYKDVAANLKVKEVRIAEHERFVICNSPEGAERDAAIRAHMIAQLKELNDGSDALGKDKRAELRSLTPGGLLRVDAAKAKAEENLDGSPGAGRTDRRSVHRQRRHPDPPGRPRQAQDRQQHLHNCPDRHRQRRQEPRRPRLR